MARWVRGGAWAGTAGLAAVGLGGVVRWSSSARPDAVDPDLLRTASHVTAVSALVLAVLTAVLVLRQPLAAAGLYFLGVFVGFVAWRLAVPGAQATTALVTALVCVVSTLASLLIGLLAPEIVSRRRARSDVG